MSQHTPQQGVRTPFKPIADAIVARLLAITGLPDGMVFWSRRRSKPAMMTNDRDIVLRVASPRPYAGGGLFEAGEVITAGLTRALSVQLRKRGGTDERQRDDIWMFGRADENPAKVQFGQTEFEEQVLLALYGFWPVSALRDELTIDPLELEGGDEFADEVKDDRTWGSSAFTFAVSYCPILRGLANGSDDGAPDNF